MFCSHSTYPISTANQSGKHFDGTFVANEANFGCLRSIVEDQARCVEVTHFELLKSLKIQRKYFKQIFIETRAFIGDQTLMAFISDRTTSGG